MNKVCVVGGEGYIGSRLCQYLRTKDYLVTIIDAGWYSDVAPGTRIHDIRYNGIEYNQFDVVVWLAGHSSVGMCRTDKPFHNCPAYGNNVSAFNNFLSNLRLVPTAKKPFVIYASSASIYGDTKGLYVNEDVIPWDMDHELWYTMGNREVYDMTKLKVDNLAAQYYKDTGEMIVGLRFGTVNGPSYNMRTELMLNSMVKNALTNGEILYSQPQLHRSILDIHHLCQDVYGLIKANENSEVACGVYNAASYTRCVYDLAEAVAQCVGSDKVELIELESTSPSKYDFKLDYSKLSLIVKNYRALMPSLSDTIRDLIKHYNEGAYLNTNRNDPHD